MQLICLLEGISDDIWEKYLKKKFSRVMIGNTSHVNKRQSWDEKNGVFPESGSGFKDKGTESIGILQIESKEFVTNQQGSLGWR